MKGRHIKGFRILVTGGAGFIGSHIAEVLAEDNEVIVLDDLSSGKRENLRDIRAELVVGSIREADKVRQVMEGVDFVFHHAAIASVPKSVDDPVSSNQVNVCGTLRVLLEARDAKVRKIVLASSASVYGESPSTVQSEEQSPAPISPYAVTKLTGECYFRSFWQVYGLPTCSLRYFNVFGPRQDPSSEYAAVVPLFIERAGRGEPLVIHGDGGQTRDLVHVKDVVQANVLAALDTDNNGEVFNVARGEQVSVNQLAEMVLQSFGRPFQGNIEHQPAREGDIRRSLADISKARSRLGYSPQVTVSQGISALCHDLV